MPKLLAPDEIDPIAEQVDQDMQDQGEEAALTKHKFDPLASFQDLSDGGQVGAARLRAMPESGRIDFKQKAEPGRPSARRVWDWRGRESTIPLSWDTDGKIHDGGRRYLLKRHCIVCQHSGFYGRVCPNCRKNGMAPKPNSIVPCFYLRKEQTPDHLHAYGGVDCMVEQCVRRGEYGFRNNTEMRQHAMKKHKDEYKAAMDEAAASKTDEISALRQELADMRSRMSAPAAPVAQAPARVRSEQEKANARERMAKLREAKKKQVPA